MRILLTFLFSIIATLAMAKANVAKEFRLLENIDSKELLNKGYSLIEKNIPDSALICYSLVANRYYTNKDDKQAINYAVKALENIGNLYMVFYYDYKRAYENLLAAEQLAEENNINDCLPYIYLSIANIISLENSSENLVTTAQELELKSFHKAMEIKDYKIAATALSGLFNKCITDGKTNYITKEVNIFLKAKLPKDMELKKYVLLECRGMEAFSHKDYEKAADFFIKAAQNVDNDLMKERFAISAMSNAAKLFIHGKQYQKAEQIYKDALALSEKGNNKDAKPDLYRNMSALYRIIGNTALEKEYDYMYLKSHAEMRQNTNLGSVKDVKFFNDLNRANEQMKELSERQQLQWIIIIVTVLVALVVSILLFRLRNAYKLIHENYRALYASNLMLLENQKKQKEEQPKYQQSRLSDDDTKTLYQLILQVFENSDEIYKQGFTIDNLCKLVNSNSRYVSQAINAEYGNNFNAMLNKYRIDEACRRFNNHETYGNYTIEAIAESVGFKSRTTFASTFKNLTGLTPSVYASMSRK